MVRRMLLVLVVSLAVCSCSHLDLRGIFRPTGDGVEKRFEQSREMNAGFNAGNIHAQESYTFYVATDPHIDQTHRNQDIFNDVFRNDAYASFGAILGDCIDVKDNFPAYLEALAYNPERHACNHKIFHVLGNHDIFFNGWVDYREMIGPSVYWFEVVFDGGKDLYIILDTATGSLGRKQTEWFRSFLSSNRDKYRHCAVLTHTNLFYTDKTQASSGNMPLEETFALIDFLGRHDVSLVLQGHDHFREDITYNNVRYTIVGSISDMMEAPEYLKINVGANGLSLHWQMID